MPCSGPPASSSVTRANRPLLGASGASRRFLGSEVDAYATYEMLERLSFLAGYAHFFPGQYVRDSSQAGAGIAVHDQGWLFAQVELRF